MRIHVKVSAGIRSLPINDINIACTVYARYCKQPAVGRGKGWLSATGVYQDITIAQRQSLKDGPCRPHVLAVNIELYHT